MRKSFYLPKSYNPEKGKGAIDDLNSLLNGVGVSFNVSKNNNGQKLYIFVDEKKLNKTMKNNSGRPVEYDFDFEKIEQMKNEGMSNKAIYESLGMSKALFYLRMKDYRENKEV